MKKNKKERDDLYWNTNRLITLDIVVAVLDTAVMIWDFHLGKNVAGATLAVVIGFLLWSGVRLMQTKHETRRWEKFFEFELAYIERERLLRSVHESTETD